jgi:hypothetical protein
VIEIEKEQFASREYNGKTYWNLKAPAGQGGFNLKPITDALEALTARVEALEAAVYEPESKEPAKNGEWDFPESSIPQESEQETDLPF